MTNDSGFDLEKEAKAYVDEQVLTSSGFEICHGYLGTSVDIDEIEREVAKSYLAGFNKGAEIERSRILDLVMEEFEKPENHAPIEGSKGHYLYLTVAQAIISKLRGEK